MSGTLRWKKVCKISMVYLKMHVENVYIKCSIEHLKRLEEQRSLSAKIYTRDERLIFRNYVLALCHEMAPSGKINQLQPKIIIPRINQVYKKSKVYRLAMVIHESTRLLPEIMNESGQVALSKIVLTGIITQTGSNVFYWL